MFLVSWNNLSVVADTFERAIEYVEFNANRIGAKLEMIGNFEDKTSPWRVYRYTYVVFDGSNKTEEIRITPIEKI